MRNTTDHEEPVVVIRDLIRATIARAASDTIGCVLLLVFAVFVLLNAKPWALDFFGGIVLLVGIGLSNWVSWSSALAKDSLENHPPSDTNFWATTFESQAKVIRSMPIWSAGLISIGSCMCLVAFWFAAKLTPLIVCIAMLTAVILAIILFWNRRAALQLERHAKRFRDSANAG